MKLPNFLYISKATALSWGMTHHGTLYGVPAWIEKHPTDPNQVFGVPKVPVLGLWCRLADAALETFMSFQTSDRYIDAPIRIGERIRP